MSITCNRCYETVPAVDADGYCFRDCDSPEKRYVLIPASERMQELGYSWNVFDTWNLETFRVCQTREYAEFWLTAMNETEDEFLERNK
jgi:hypothetical protein